VTYRGTIKNGVVVLPPDTQLADGTQVRVETVNGEESGGVDLRSRGINEAQAAELRARLSSFAEDWDSPEMDLYDNYDAAKANL
jgi:hypothetical protein